MNVPHDIVGAYFESGLWALEGTVFGHVYQLPKPYKRPQMTPEMRFRYQVICENAERRREWMEEHD